MSTWKKVHVEDANTTHGTITATLADNSSSMTSAGSVHVVTVANDGQSEQALTTRTITLSSGAFTSVSGTNTGDEPDASTTQKGIVELATTAETTTGTDATRAVTPDGLKDGYEGSSNVTTLGTIATGVWNGTDIGVAHGGTGASTAADARTNLGLVIGTNVQAHDSNLTSFLSALDLPTADGNANQVLATNGSGTLSFADAAVNTDINVNTTNLRARLADLDNSSTIIIGDASDTTVKIAGNLQVVGTTETVSTTELKVEDVTIAVASGSTASSQADGAGLEVDIDADSNYTANPAILFQDSHTTFSQFLMRKGVTGESNAFIAAMTTAADTTALDALTPGAGTFAMVSNELYIQLS